MARASLTATYILNKTRKDRLDDVRELNAWGQDVEDLSVLSELPYVEVLALACNKIRTLKQLKWCTKLRQLLLRKNQISDIAEVYHLSKLQNLQVLSLSENPMCTDSDYRLKVLAYLPRLQKLDDVRVNPDEVEEARAKFPDAPHGISQDGSSVSFDGSHRTPPSGPSPSHSPAVTPPRAQMPMPPQPQSQTPPHMAYPSSGTAPGGSHQPDGLPYYSGSQQGHQGLQQNAYGTPPPNSFANGAALPSPQAYYSPGPQQLPYNSPNGGLAAASAQHHQSGTPPPDQAGAWMAAGGNTVTPREQPGYSSSAPGGSSADNIFYAVVALLPELSAKHLQWVKDEVDARLLEVQQQQMHINR